jgi:hypothetical protein
MNRVGTVPYRTEQLFPDLNTSKSFFFVDSEVPKLWVILVGSFTVKIQKAPAPILTFCLKKRGF